MQKFRRIKEEIRVIAWDDGPFEFGTTGKDILVGVIFRGGKILDGFLKTEVEIDGLDATGKIIDKILKTKHKDLRIVMLDGITVAGFNIIDIKEIYRKTRLSVIAVIRKKPDMKKFILSLKNLPHFKRRKRYLENAGNVYSATIKNKRIFFQCYGIEKSDAEEIIRETSTVSLTPEPLRAAHIIATGFVLGESVGRA